MDYLERGPINETIPAQEWLVAPAPRLQGFVPIFTIATVFAVPFSFVIGFIATGQPFHGLYALPLVQAFVAYLLKENLS
jgi:hypothetical protein